MSRPWARQDRDAVILSVRVQPGAARTEAAGEYADALEIRLAAPPVDGKANATLIAFVARQLDVPRSKVALISGAASRHKRLQVSGTTLEVVAAAFLPDADRTQAAKP